MAFFQPPSKKIAVLTFFGEKKKSKNEVFSECRFFEQYAAKKNFKLMLVLESRCLYVNCMNDFVFSFPNLF